MAIASASLSGLRVVAEVAVIAAFGLSGMLAAGWWLTIALALPPLLPPPYDVLGWIAVVIGAGSLVQSARFLSTHGRGTPYPRAPPMQLVTTGPFARVRNPMVLAWGALFLGLGVALRLTGLIVLLLPIAPAIHVYVVYREEPLLIRRFGHEYEAYRRQVPRWIPRLRVSPHAGSQGGDDLGSARRPDLRKPS